MKDYVVLDIGSYSIKLLYGHYTNGFVIVTKSGFIRSPEGLVNNGLLDVDLATEAITELMRNLQIKPKKSGIAVVESTAIVSRNFTLPYANPTDLQGMVTMEVERLFSEVLQNYIIDYSCLNIRTDADGAKADVMVFALPDKIFRSYQDTFINVGLLPHKLDVASNSSSKTFRKRVFINDVACPVDKTVALLDIGHTMMNVQIIERGVLKFNRAIKMGGIDITKAISQDLYVSMEEAEQLKVTEADLLALVNSPLKISVSRVVDDIAAEVQRVLNFYTSSNTYASVDSIFMYGGTSRLKNVAKYMSRSLGHEIEVIDNMNIIHLKQELPLNCYPSDFINATGALMNI
ncbi:MAG: pilus assembly protein PilM [Clostridia bacterium]|nr:pilus assembly protein PilM [Clostridia bacterium]